MSFAKGEKPSGRRQRRMSGRAAQSCREGDGAARICLWKGSVSSQLLWEATASMALLTNCTALLFFFFSSSLFLQFIFLTRSMMLLQTENNRDRVSAKAISELNQS